MESTTDYFHNFDALTDPRINRRKIYRLKTLVFICISAVVAGAESFTEIAEFAAQKVDWLRKYVELPEGRTPSHDTLNDLFRRIIPTEFQNCFLNWTAQICNITAGELIAVDGKTLRGSYDKYDGKSAIHMISAWACNNELVLGQLKVADKSNEITAIPELLDLLAISGSIVSTDAMGCQKPIAKKIIAKQADYILAVKQNQASLYAEIESIFNNKTASIETTVKTEKNQGRLEQRQCEVVKDLKFLEEAKNWEELKSIIKITSKRELLITGKKQSETRYYISSTIKTAEEFNSLIRQHWGVENKLHWVLDVNFNEDKSRIRKGYGDQNFSTIRRIALNIIKLNKTGKTSQRVKRKKAGWSMNFLEKLLKL